MDIQAGTHAGPCDLLSIISKTPGNRQHGVWLGSGSPRGHDDDRRITGTAKSDILHVVRSPEFVTDPLVGEKGNRPVFLADGGCGGFHYRRHGKRFADFCSDRIIGVSGDGQSQDDDNYSHDNHQLNKRKATGRGNQFLITGRFFVVQNSKSSH